jgi:hypothetical protein
MSMPRKLLLCLAIVITVVVSRGGSAVAEPNPKKPFGIVPGSFHFVPSTYQAGAHSNWVTSFDFEHSKATGKTFNDVRTIVVNLPAGFDASSTAVPTCTPAQLLGSGSRSECPPDSQIGTITFDLTLESVPVESTFPFYNMEVTSSGIAAELGIHAVVLTQILDVRARPDDEGLTITTPDIENTGELHDFSVDTWGIPASHEHDAERGQECFEQGGKFECGGGGEKVNVPLRPFLSNPTSCGPHTASMEAESWEEPGSWSKASFEVPPIVECERIPFAPSIEAQPSTRFAESPTGLDVSLLVPQTWEKPESVATANLKATRFTLPEGVTANPSLASGLGACTPQQYQAETAASLPGEGCPPESKIGSIEIETPLLAEKIPGAIYIAKPYDNPFNSLLALYVVAKLPSRGIIIKVAGQIEPNPVTGQLVTTFASTPAFEGLPGNEGTPQQPFSRFTLKFRPGATAPLVSPPACGSYAAEAELTPWSNPVVPQLVDSPPFVIENGIGGGPCPAGGIPPFHPALTAGTLNNSAGSYSQMDIHITRNDGEQEITRFSSILPPGLTANLSGVPFCPNADVEAAKNVSGAQEEASPSCPQASEIGHSLVGAGVGSVLAYTPGKIYLAGPYNGAPFSVVSITSAKVGPFDLGTVVIRFALEINPETAVVTVDAKASDPIPHIIKGIIIHVRDIHVYIDRNQFMINPTNCNPLNFAATVGGGGQDPTNPADQQYVTTNTPFQLANCQSLQFKPKFSVSTSGKTSRTDGASLTAKLAVPGALGTQANISRVKVELPVQLPSRLPTLQKACTAAQFETNPAGCPLASIIGHAKAITPILPVPLEGPAYFVSHGGEGWPSLVIVLQGYGVTIDLVGTTFISKAGVTSSTFKTVPDQPVTSFELTLPDGPYSALTALGNFCTAKKLTMPTELLGQNGALIKQSTKIAVTGCPKHKKAAKKASHRRKKTSHRKTKP